MKYKKNQAWNKSFVCACRGFWLVAARERNMKIHCLAAVTVVILAYMYKVTAVEWALLFLAVAAVLVTELLNTAVEGAVDLICPHFSQEAGFIKDAAAGAVLVASLFAVAIAYLVFFDRIFS